MTTELEKRGIDLDDFSKSQARVLERSDSPVATFGIELDEKLWRALGRKFKALAGITQIPGMELRYGACRHVCDSMADWCRDSKTNRPVADALLEIYNFRAKHGFKHPYVDGDVARIMREQTYIWLMEEFAGRQTG